MGEGEEKSFARQSKGAPSPIMHQSFLYGA